MKVLLHLAPGFEEIEAVTTIDILRRANITTQVVSIVDCLQVTGAHGIELRADISFARADYKDADMLILPGGLPGSHNLAKHEGLAKKIQAHFNQEKWLAAICAAPLVYGRMGLLKGIEATCYPSFEPELKGAIISNNSVAVSGKFITAKGPGVTMDFALEIVKQLKGEDAAKQTAQGLIKQ
ncbi:MAG: DJ-1/PfpI family protein [Bacteroidales bacterium]|jgi:4-methyl-5(b-hydroxyethyl)-thiazole monophosphate biosynthesis|nr:DJ-1/PfpI family protein [Bacteroidales bacterium]